MSGMTDALDRALVREAAEAAQRLSPVAGRVRERGYTLVPLRLYLKGGWAKVELALARGKKRYDKRAAIAQREAQRRMAQALRARR